LPIRFAVLFPPVLSGLKSNNFNYLILILACLAGATRAGASSGEAPPTRAATAGDDVSQPKRELLLICCRCSRVKYSIQFMIVVNCERSDLSLGHGIGAERGVGKYLAQLGLQLALPVQLSAIVSR
jgi:hypothetical protein